MPLELKDIANLISLPADIDDVEKAKKYIEETFIPRKLVFEDETVKTELGKRVGEVLGEATKNTIKGFGLNAKDFEGKKIAEIVEAGVTGFKTQLEEAKKGSGEPDKEVKKWETKFNQLQTDFETIKGIKEKVEGEFGTYKSETETKIKQNQISFILEAAKGKVKFKDGMSPAEKRGFETALKEDYKIDLDENNNPVIFDLAGKKLTKGNDFMKLDDFLETVAEQTGVLAKNNARQGQGKGSGFNGNQNNNGNQNGRVVRKPLVDLKK